MIDAANVDISMVKFDDKGLVPAVVQEENGQVLMLAYMNEESLRKTLETGFACYYSRSRKTLWKKGRLQAMCRRSRKFPMTVTAIPCFFGYIKQGWLAIQEAILVSAAEN